MRSIKNSHLLIAGIVLLGLYLAARGGRMPQPWNMHAVYQPEGMYGGGQ